MKNTAITAIILSIFFAFTATASAQSETSVAVQTETSIAESTRQSIAAPSDYVPEPQEDIVIEYRTPEGRQGYGDNKNLDYYFHSNGYPEYISYIGAYDKFLAEGDELVIQYRAGLTDMSQENIDEVLSVMDSSCWVVFEQASYSYNERMAVYEQLRTEFPECHISFGYETEMIIIYAPEGTMEKYLEKLDGRFGGLVFVSDIDGVLYDAAVGTSIGERVSVPDGGLGGDGIITGVITNPPATETKPAFPVFAAIAAALLLLTGAAFLLIRRNHLRVNSNGTAAAAAIHTKNDVKQLISDSAESPHPELRDRII